MDNLKPLLVGGFFIVGYLVLWLVFTVLDGFCWWLVCLSREGWNLMEVLAPAFAGVTFLRWDDVPSLG